MPPLLDVPPEVWGHLHEPFREGRTASLFGLRNSAVLSEYTSLGNAALLWLPNLSTGLYLFITIMSVQMSGNYWP